MRRTLQGLCTTLFVVAIASAQTRPEFEVATVKVNKSGDPGMMVGTPSPERYMATNVTLSWIMQHAWNVRPFQISGLSGPVASSRWDIQASMQPGRTQADIQLMMQALMEERFGLKVHRETREGSAYALSVAKSGMKVLALPEGSCVTLQPGEKPPAVEPGQKPPMNCGGASWGPGTVKMSGVTLERFSATLAEVLERTVVDRTGTSGLFDLKVEWAKDSSLADGPSVFTALQEQLGLKLDSVKAPIEMLIVDEVHPPSEN